MTAKKATTRKRKPAQGMSLMAQVIALEAAASKEITDIIKYCETMTGREHPIVQRAFPESKVVRIRRINRELEEGQVSLACAMEALGKIVKERWKFKTGKDFIDWATPLIIKGGRCR